MATPRPRSDVRRPGATGGATARFRHGEEAHSCPLQLGFSLVGGRWRAAALYHVARGVVRFGDLKRAIGTISERTLARELKALTQLGLLERQVFPSVPAHTEYRLTALGAEAQQALEPFRRWARRFKTEAE